MRSRSDRLVAVATLGAFVVVAGVLGLVSLYLGAVTQAMSGLQRTTPLPDYSGRPSPQHADGPAATRFLVLVSDDDGRLASAYLAQLSSASDALHLVGLPANLLVADAQGKDSTLAARFGAGPMIGIMSGVQGRRPRQGSASTRSPSGKSCFAIGSARASWTGVFGASRSANSAPVVRRMPCSIGARK